MGVTKEKSFIVDREVLKTYRDLKREITEQARRIDTLERSIKEHERGIWLFGSQKRLRPQPVPEHIVQEKIGLEVSMILNLEVLEQRAAAIENAIQELESPLYRELLRLKYIEGLKWSAVGDKLNYVPRQCQRFHTYALEALEHTKRVARRKTIK